MRAVQLVAEVVAETDPETRWLRISGGHSAPPTSRNPPIVIVPC